MQYAKRLDYGIFYSMHRYRGATVETQGLTFIQDGREFIVNETRKPGNFLQTYPNPDPQATEFFSELAENIVPISENVPCSCAECGGFLELSLQRHTLEWMYASLNCKEHPTGLAVVDVFPKVKGHNTEHDWSNVFSGIGFTCSMDEEKAWEQCREEASGNRYLLTPDGLERIRIRRGFLGLFFPT